MGMETTGSPEELNTIDFTSCIEACIQCALECESCSDACIDDGMKESARITRDCADICWQSAAMMGRDSSLSLLYCNTCENVCALCAEECEKNPDVEHCRACADACRRCAAECSGMSRKAAA